MHRRYYLMSYMIPFTAITAYLYFTPNQFIQSVNSFFGIPLPSPLGNYWSAVYATPAAILSFLGSFLAAKGVHDEERER